MKKDKKTDTATKSSKATRPSMQRMVLLHHPASCRSMHTTVQQLRSLVERTIAA